MNYGFFDYKYNISGYSGQDFDSLIRILYPLTAVILIPLLLKLMKRKGTESTERLLKFLSVYLIIEEVFKITWESYWDVTTGRGFNFGGILPLDTCSIFLYVLPFAAWGSGRVKRCALAWMSSIGVLGGISYLLFPMVLKWYPVVSFGAWHSLLFHFMMVFTGLAVVYTGMIRINRKDILNAFVPQMLMSLIVIPVNYLFKWDYMLLRNASGIPFVEDIASRMWRAGHGYLTSAMVMALYLFMDTVLTISNHFYQQHTHSRDKNNNHIAY